MFFMALSFGMWKDVIYVAADINSSKSRWQSLHNIFNTFFYEIIMFFLVCIWAVLFSHTWSPAELLNWHFLEIFTQLTRQLSCYSAVLLDINDYIFPMSFKAGYEELARDSKPMTSREIVWLNKIAEYVTVKPGQVYPPRSH